MSKNLKIFLVSLILPVLTFVMMMTSTNPSYTFGETIGWIPIAWFVSVFFLKIGQEIGEGK